MMNRSVFMTQHRNLKVADVPHSQAPPTINILGGSDENQCDY